MAGHGVATMLLVIVTTAVFFALLAAAIWGRTKDHTDRGNFAMTAIGAFAGVTALGLAVLSQAMAGRATVDAGPASPSPTSLASSSSPSASKVPTARKAEEPSPSSTTSALRKTTAAHPRQTAEALAFPQGSQAVRIEDAATVLPAGWSPLATDGTGGPSGDDTCDRAWLAKHPNDADTSPGVNTYRSGWLPGQTEIFWNDVDTQKELRSPAFAAGGKGAWHWRCGPDGPFITLEQFSADCRALHPELTIIKAHLRDPDDPYSWECVSPHT